MKGKLEIIVDKAPFTAEEAAAHQDFGAVMKAHRRLVRLRKLRWGGIGGGSALLIGATLWWASIQQSDSTLVISEVDQLGDYPTRMMELPAVPEPPQPARAMVAPEETPELEKEVPATSQVASTLEEESEPMPPAREEIPAPELVQAFPLKGYPALYEYLRTETHYPDQVLPDSVEGIVLVAFSIDTLGSPQNVRVAESLHPVLDHEATRVIRNMPKWQPAMLDGRPVSSRLAIPITFRIVTADPPGEQ